MRRELHGEVLQAISDRTTWEDRQRVWYMMRHDGLRRRKKPYANAADLHYPLIDTLIEKLKPFYANLPYSSEHLAHFVSLKPDPPETAASAAELFDYQLKHRSNFEEEINYTIDFMLMAGRGSMKVLWDFKAKALKFEGVDSFNLIVPSNANTLEAADWFVHVKPITLGAYKRARIYNTDPSLVDRIKGSKQPHQHTELENEKSHREGLTYTQDSSLILLWEVYEKTMGGWTVHTYCPTAPDMPVREPFGLPFRFMGQPVLNWVSFPFEIKDKGWYAPRGLAERQGMFETWLCKLWNWKADSIDFLSKPLFTNKDGIANAGNFRFQPGDVLAQGIEPLNMPPPPMELDHEMNNTRTIADLNLNMPDASLPSQNNREERVTAAEIDYRRALATQGVDLRGRIFRLGLGDLFRKSWAIYLQYANEESAYWIAGDRKVMPQQAMHDQYHIMPEGSPEQWNKQIRYQRSLARYQLLNGHPNINQEELVKTVLEDDDPRIVKRLYVPSQMRASNEAEDEAMEIVILMSGFPAQAMPYEDHALRIRILAAKLQQLSMGNAPVDPTAKQRIHEHIAQHMQFLKQQNPQLAAQLINAAKEFDADNEQATPMAGNF